MPPPSHFLLHDVAANTYSRDLIPNTGVHNLHRLFAVSPRWYNRSKHKRNGVTVVRYKHATPRRDIRMVDLRHALRRVQRVVADAHLVGGVKMAAAAKVAGAVALAGLSANYLYNYYNTHVAPPSLTKTKQARQQELNSECLKQLKTAIGQKNTNHPDVRVSCVPEFEGKELTKDKVIGEGMYGKVFSVVGNDRVVIKEQTALCYPFYNEIDCLYALQNTGIVPLLYNAYICSDPPVADATENSQITYGYVMQKLDMSLVDFINNTANKDLDLDDIADKISAICDQLDKVGIYHRDLHLANFMVVKENNNLRLFVIDFGNAVSPNPSRRKTSVALYLNPLLPDVSPPISNSHGFINNQVGAFLICNGSGVVTEGNKALCVKPLILLGLAQRVMYLKVSDASANWMDFEREYNLPRSGIP